MKYTISNYFVFLVLSAIVRGSRTFEEISRNCGGLYPKELKDVLDYLIKKRHIEYIDNQYFPIDDSHRFDLPKPHPHDFDWRFDARTTEKIAALVKNESILNGSALMVGTPTIFTYLTKHYPSVHSILIDNNKSLVESVKQLLPPDGNLVVNFNLLSGKLCELDRKVDVTVIDPPWYTEYYRAFLAQASYATHPGGSVVVSFLPMNTRPGAIEDRRKIIHVAHNLGLHIYALQPEQMGYISPDFETNSLMQKGINISDNWRKGDLLLFKKAIDVGIEKIQEVISSCQANDDGNEWSEFLLGRYKIKIRNSENDDTEPEIISIVPNDILETVSLRHASRSKVDLWLWNNKVYGLKGKRFFLYALHEISGKHLEKSSSINEAYVQSAKKQLNDLFMNTNK